MAKEEENENKKVKRPTAKKRDIQSKKRNLRNRVFKSTVKTAIRALEQKVSQGDSLQAKEELKKIYSLVDKGVKKRHFKLNTAGRIKARFAKKLAPTV
jgi:small subunit ribosomal protein S20